MIFNTLAFAKFFAVVFVVSWALTRFPRARFGFLSVMSYVFYAGLDVFGAAFWSAIPELGLYGALRANAPHLLFVPIVFIGSTVDYYLGILIDAASEERRRKRLLYVTIAMNTGLLLVFKYWDFMAEQLLWLGGATGANLPDIRLHLPLPIGISFFTFMSLSYVVDVYRREIPASRNYVHYVTYIAFFPHLVAGPIIRGKDLLPLFAKPVALNATVAGEAMFLVSVGLFKKVVISDYLAINLVDRVVAEPTSFSSLEVAFGMFGYAIQIYCDFSGYSDVAIGIALLLGYRLKINFDQPFKSTNLVEFWRRWHISLSTWLRDYVYIPLGGSRHGKGRKYLNVWITMVVCGIWHGAAWSYVIFGVIQGLAVAGTHAWFDARGKRPTDSGTSGVGPRQLAAVLACFVFTTLTFVLIRAPIDKAWLLYQQLFQLSTFTPNLTRGIVAVIAGALVLQWLPKRWFEVVRDAFVRAPAPAQAVALFLLALVLREAASSEAVPFVYGQF